MRLRHEIRRVVQRAGFDIVRYPLGSSMARTVLLLDHHKVDCVIDVGANDGGFGTAIRSLGYKGRIISFEPLSGPFQSLSRKAAADPLWDVLQCAVGDAKGEVTINVSGNDGLSSSILPMLERHTAVAPGSRYVDTPRTPQECLDGLLPTFDISPSANIFLKVDVQGYEKHVLDGAPQLLASRSLRGVQLELSLVPLYADAMKFREALDRLESLGMSLMALDPVMADPDSGQLLQVDAVFFRNSSS